MLRLKNASSDEEDLILIHWMVELICQMVVMVSQGIRQDGDGSVIPPDQMPDYEEPEQDGKPNDDQKFNGGNNYE